MPREWRFRVQDILTALARIEQYTTGLDYQAFAADNKTFDAVVRNLEIVGESARFIPKAITTRWPAVPWARMRGLRNYVIHQYFAIGSIVPRFGPQLSKTCRHWFRNSEQSWKAMM